MTDSKAKKLLLIIILIAVTASSLVLFCQYSANSAWNIDFCMRYNETEAVLSGMDPYLVWNGTIKQDKYIPFSFDRIRPGGGSNMLHVYPPWTYTYMMPLCLLGRNNGKIVFSYLGMAIILIIFITSYLYGYSVRHSHIEGLICLALVSQISDYARVCLEVGNFGIVITGLCFLMIYCLNRKHDVFAGVCWALMMVKPQLALLVAIPLLIQGKFKTVITAACICLAASIPPAVLCHRSPLTMIFSIFDYTQNQFYLTGLFPQSVYSFLSGIFAESVIVGINGIIVSAICFTACYLIRKQNNWLISFLPVTICCTIWTVARNHDHVIGAVALTGLSCVIISSRNIRELIVCGLLLISFLFRSLDELCYMNVFSIMTLISLVFFAAKIVKNGNEQIFERPKPFWETIRFN